ncbi:CRISPR-associated endonuclease Cas2 [Enteroscipio rubneri]|uniref:CRISPR-associated endoribonuclease Cas2 n=2 Tax=Enteroscipio rubneri TaxID=2070686 RepID=A0A2K2UAL7_9ACTN|nr:CRISPR-associated endonuclease Cas2 [Enteroscipio rubneri]
MHAMLTVITYDVNTEDPEGRRRLRKVARHCVNYGQRVQNSVFECVADAATMVKIKGELVDLIDPDKDSLRFYYLGNKYQTKVEHIGAKPSYEAEGFLAL